MPRILVVEDDQRTAESINLYVEHDGFEVRLAPDGLAALDLVILNRMFPCSMAPKSAACAPLATSPSC